MQWGLIASMGPRLFSRGKSGLAGASMGHRPLQWGRGCSAAERLNGRRLVHAWQGFNGAAAVQPRKDYCQHEDCTWKLASMGPRLFSRGKLPPPPSVSYTIPLQWGRGCSAAERPAQADRHRGGLRSFNGAAAVQPRKDDALSVIVAKRSRLQWGRGCSAAERRRPALRQQPADASMGPRLFSRGKIHAVVSRDQLALASMGPRLFSRGKGNIRSKRCRGSRASMGPRLFSRGKVAFATRRTG